MTDFVWPTILIANAVIVVLIAVFAWWVIHRNKKSGYPFRDERTIKISGNAAIGTYYITLVFMISLTLFNIFGTEFLDWPQLDAGWAINITMLVMGFSNALLSWYYSRKGDL